MRIAITLRIDSAQEYEEKRDVLSHEWIAFLEEMNYCPILIPNVFKNVREYIEQLNIEALLLTGGNDICVKPKDEVLDWRVGRDVFPERDITEMALLDIAVEKKLPVFGVCRGMQMINAYFGGSLVDDLKSKVGAALNHVANNHEVRIVKDTFKEFFGVSSFSVNSYHHHGVTLNTLAGNELIPFAISVTGNVVEGLCHKYLPILGVQWHPERKNPAAEIDKKLFEVLFKKKVFW